jgi:catechol 2,3-dioxygenase-like lactoylglutathione lyase family enzyme
MRFHHLGLTSRDIEKTVAFFVDNFGFEKIGGKPEYPSIFIRKGEVMLTVWQVHDKDALFDRRKQLGLHHVAFEISQDENLDKLYENLRSKPGVEIEFAPVARSAGTLRHMRLFEPGGCRLEFVGN